MELKDKLYPIRIPNDFHKEFKMFCAERNIPMYEFALKAIKEKINRETNKEG